ncbi:MAG: ATP-binding cassette domain-containing protein [Coriobacteriales bacterium]|jgi:ABC-2 type transport system ATP-binding protein|nr:ATP-binding cassette domain-containing protein [Coriobacteriales bacterium]
MEYNNEHNNGYSGGGGYAGQRAEEQVLLRTVGLTKRYGRQVAVNSVDMTLRRGEVYGLVGQNGAGKTTLIRLVCGLTLPSAGAIELMGETSPAGLCQARGHLGSMVEAPRFYPNLSAAQNLEYYRLQRGIPDDACVRKALAMVELADTGAKRFLDFSLGMKQRLGLALAVMARPELVILDEPANGLDPMGIIMVRDVIRRLASEGMSFLVSSHILSELSQIATCYGFIHRGVLLLQLSEQEVAETCRRALQLTVGDTAAAAALLETRLGIRDYKIVSANVMRLYTHLSESASIAQALVGAGIAVSGLAEVSDSLEDFYTALIEGRTR